MFRFRQLHLQDFRCFETLDLELEPDLTVLFAENGGGKTALLNALAMGLAVFQPGTPRDLALSATRDPRQVTLDERGGREPVGPCTVSWTADVGAARGVEWSTTANPASGSRKKQHSKIREALDATRLPGERWPLFAWYGTDRLGRARTRRTTKDVKRDRWEAYASSLDPALSDGPLLQWLLEEILGDAIRHRRGEPERFLDAAVMDTAVRATRSVSSAWYDPVERSPIFQFDDGHAAPWSELSDGFHVFLALVADIARRAVMLNGRDGGEAPLEVEGVVLIDEVDLHLHPRWQRGVLDGLRAAFPKLQLVVTTHSPQVLSSAKNRQVRLLVDGRIAEYGVFVQGRDSNAILRELMRTGDRDEEGQRALSALHDAIDAGRVQEAERLYAELIDRWGDSDPDLLRARGFLDREE